MGVRIWCLRHAESEANANLPDAIDDCGLTPLGRRQAIAASQPLAAEPIATIYSSTALRARHTAALLATALAAPGASTTALPELIEADVSAEVLRAWIVEQRLGRHARNGETGHQVVARVTTAFQKVALTHPRETVALVGHVASLTVALARLCALGPGVWGTPLPHAHPFLVEWDGTSWHCPAWPALSPAT